MKRRTFIKQNSQFIAAGITLPYGIFKIENCPNVLFEGRKSLDKTKEEYFSMSVCLELFKNFEQTDGNGKRFELTIIHYPDTKARKQNHTYKALYALKSVFEKDENTYEFTAEFISAYSLEYPMPKAFNQKIIHGKFHKETKFYTITLYSKTNDNYVTLRYDDVFEKSKEDCFISSATLMQLGKLDNGKELNILRDLRDTYMLQNESGRELIRDYKQIAPKLVERINSFENKQAIYNGIYTQLIEKSINLIESNKKEEAVMWYKNYVTALKKIYL